MYHKYLEPLIEEFTTGEYYREVYNAKQEYFEKAGIVYEDDLEFEERMCMFMDWYLFDRDLPGVDLPPIKFYFRKTKTSFQVKNSTFIKIFALPFILSFASSEPLGSAKDSLSSISFPIRPTLSLILMAIKALHVEIFLKVDSFLSKDNFNSLKDFASTLLIWNLSSPEKSRKSNSKIRAVKRNSSYN